MKTWEVTVPIVGRALLTVEAETEEEAITLALGEAAPKHVDEWTAMRHVVRGNVCYADPSAAYADCISEDDGL